MSIGHFLIEAFLVASAFVSLFIVVIDGYNHGDWGRDE